MGLELLFSAQQTRSETPLLSVQQKVDSFHILAIKPFLHMLLPSPVAKPHQAQCAFERLVLVGTPTCLRKGKVCPSPA